MEAPPTTPGPIQVGVRARQVVEDRADDGQHRHLREVLGQMGGGTEDGRGRGGSVRRAIAAVRRILEHRGPDVAVPLAELLLLLRIAHDHIAHRLPVAALRPVARGVQQPLEDVERDGILREEPAGPGRLDRLDDVHRAVTLAPCVACPQVTRGGTRMELDEVIAEFQIAAGEFARGNPEPVKRLYVHSDDATLANPFGPPVHGWPQVSAALDHASGRFRDGRVTQFERVAAYVTADLASIVEVEHWEAKVGEREDITPFVLRVSSTYRRE